MSLLHQEQPFAGVLDEMMSQLGLTVLFLDTYSILWVYMPIGTYMVFMALISLNG